jgi:A/G-specific adenine glycosylase
VLIAELCLQRSRADQIEALFGALARAAPTPADVVDEPRATLETLLALGLGARAHNVIEVAGELAERFGGQVPDNDFDLRSLSGVGDYVIQAVLCFAFGRRAVLLDTSTMRLIGRLYGHEDSRRWQLRLDLHRLAGAEGPNAAFNFALLDLGALVCQPEQPRCHACPLRSSCVTGSGRPAANQMELTAETAG